MREKEVTMFRKWILYVQYTNPAIYSPMEHSGLILLKAGWDVRYFGIQSEGQSKRVTFSEPLAGRVILWKRQPPGFKQKLHFVAFTLMALWMAMRRRPAWVYCSDLMSCPAVWLIGRLTRCRVLYHEHDSPEARKQKAETLKTEILKTEDEGQQKAGKLKLGNKADISAFQNFSVSEFKEISAFQSFLLWCREHVGREADLVVLPNQKRLELFVQATGRQGMSFCVNNCPRLDEVRPQKVQQSSNGRLRLAFQGSINRDRLPMALLPALARLLGKVELQIVGFTTVGSSNYLKEFMTEAEHLQLGGLISFVGAVPQRRSVLDLASQADIGVAFMPLTGGDVNMENMTGASQKSFEYLACGVALLVSARSDWDEIFVRPGYGLACNPDDADSIATQLRWFLDHPAETREMGERGRQRILTEWYYERQFAAVLAALGNAE